MSRVAPAFPVYQIDFSAVAAGKRVAASKRRIRWRFGFPNLKAIEEGRSGTDCRGEEHEVVVIWSVTSGKRQILMDGREVHYSANRVGILDFSWNTKGNHVLKVTCHAAPPLSATPGFRQYDMFIDGQSFFNMPKVYELGVRGVSAMENRQPMPYGGGGGYETGFSPRSSYSGVGGGYDRDDSSSFRVPRTSTEEDEELQRAIRASLEESKRHLKEASPPDVLDSAPAPAPATADLLDFGGPEPVAALPAIMPDASYGAPALPPSTTPSYDAGYGAPPPPPQPTAYDGGYAVPPTQYGAPPAYGAAPPAYGAAPPPAYGAPPPPPTPQYPALPSSQPMPALPPSQPPAYGAPPTAAYGAPPPAYGASPQPSYASAGTGTQYEDPFAPKPPTFHDTANDILKNYGPSATTPSPAMTPGRYQPGQPFFSENSTAPPQNYMSPPAHEAPQQEQVNGNHGFGGTPLTMEKLAIADEEEPQNPFDAALKKLVNIDHIDEPAEEKLKLTMKKQEDEKAKKNKGKSVPLPPVAQRKLGSGATLGEISQVKPQQEKKSVMQPPQGLFHGDPAMYGALVVHGQGPPPLQQQGFGVVHMQSQMAAARQYMYGAPPQFQQYSQQQPPPPPQPQQTQQGYGYR